MKEIKFIHCADIHLGAPFTSLGSNLYQCSLRRLDQKLTFESMINTALQEKVDLLLISGDLFEHDYIQKSGICFLNDCFARIPDTQIFIVPGNHDPLVANSYYRSYPWGGNVHILSEEKLSVAIREKGVCVYGAGFDILSLERLKNGSIKPSNPEWMNILMFHGTLDMNFTRKAYNPVSSSVLDESGMDYIALGHFHTRLEKGGKKGNIYNPGSLEPLGFDEPGEHGFFIGTLRKSGISGCIPDVKFTAAARKYYEKVSVGLNGCETDEQVIGRIRDTLCDKRLDNGIFHIVLQGLTERDYTPDITQIHHHFKDQCFFLKLSDETEPAYDLEALAGEAGLKGLFTRKMLALADAKTDEHQRKLVIKALYYGLQALERGEVQVRIES